MKQMTTWVLRAAALLVLLPAVTNAQPFAATGSRAVGMGGAFVAVADDASAIYWNPAGLAPGALFSLVIDWGTAEAVPASATAGRDGSAFLVALTTPALGLGYYRLHERSATPVPFSLTPASSHPAALSAPARRLSTVGELQLDSLITHHTGVTIVQSVTQGVAVGTTLKVVRGVAASQRVVSGSPEEALGDAAADLLGHASNQFDLDFGVIAYGGPLKAGLTFRNIREPGFRTAGDGLQELVLERQVRAGVAYSVSSHWLVAADGDLEKTGDAFGARRDVALGVEGLLWEGLAIRSGLSLNTAAETGTPTTYSVGGSYLVRGSIFLDGHFTTGSDRAGTRWGVAARFVY